MRAILESRTLTQLKKMVRDTNITGYSKLKKSEIIDKMMKEDKRFQDYVLKNHLETLKTPIKKAPTHKMPDGKIMSGKTHKKESKEVKKEVKKPEVKPEKPDKYILKTIPKNNTEKQIFELDKYIKDIPKNINQDYENIYDCCFNITQGITIHIKALTAYMIDNKTKKEREAIYNLTNYKELRGSKGVFFLESLKTYYSKDFFINGWHPKTNKEIINSVLKNKESLLKQVKNKDSFAYIDASRLKSQIKGVYHYQGQIKEPERKLLSFYYKTGEYQNKNKSLIVDNALHTSKDPEFLKLLNEVKKEVKKPEVKKPEVKKPEVKKEEVKKPEVKPDEVIKKFYIELWKKYNTLKQNQLLVPKFGNKVFSVDIDDIKNSITGNLWSDKEFKDRIKSFNKKISDYKRNKERGIKYLLGFKKTPEQIINDEIMNSNVDNFDSLRVFYSKIQLYLNQQNMTPLINFEAYFKKTPIEEEPKKKNKRK